MGGYLLYPGVLEKMQESTGWQRRRQDRWRWRQNPRVYATYHKHVGGGASTKAGAVPVTAWGGEIVLSPQDPDEGGGAPNDWDEVRP